MGKSPCHVIYLKNHLSKLRSVHRCSRLWPCFRGHWGLDGCLFTPPIGVPLDSVQSRS